MTIQIAVRVREETAEEIDRWVAEGVYRSRAAAVDAMTRRERRRQDALHDAEIYARSGADAELEAWAEMTTGRDPWSDLD